jgi:hypothetical protein
MTLTHNTVLIRNHPLLLVNVLWALDEKQELFIK